MKKLLMITLALALVLSILPKAEAEESATLNLEVTFSLEPLRIWSEPKGPFEVKEGDTLEFRVFGEDKDTSSVKLAADGLPEGATWITVDQDPPQQPLNRAEGIFEWTPKFGQAQEKPYMIYFRAENAEGEQQPLVIEITVLEGMIISIELNETSWILEGVKPGEKRSNYDETNVPIHRVRNTGNVEVKVDIGYGLRTYVWPSVHPGLEQGLDTFITILGEEVLPPNGRLNLNHAIQPGEEEPLSLIYGAPTELSEPVQGMGAIYELRAYPPFFIE